MAEDWSDLLEPNLRKMFTDEYLTDDTGWYTKEQLFGTGDPEQLEKQTLESIIDEQCRKLKEVSYD